MSTKKTDSEIAPSKLAAASAKNHRLGKPNSNSNSNINKNKKRKSLKTSKRSRTANSDGFVLGGRDEYEDDGFVVNSGDSSEDECSYDSADEEENENENENESDEDGLSSVGSEGSPIKKKTRPRGESVGASQDQAIDLSIDSPKKPKSKSKSKSPPPVAAIQQLVDSSESSDNDGGSGDEYEAETIFDEELSEATRVLQAVESLTKEIIDEVKTWCGGVSTNTSDSATTTTNELDDDSDDDDEMTKPSSKSTPTKQQFEEEGALAMNVLKSGSNNPESGEMPATWISSSHMRSLCPSLKLADYQLLGVNWLALLGRLKFKSSGGGRGSKRSKTEVSRNEREMKNEKEKKC